MLPKAPQLATRCSHLGVADKERRIDCFCRLGLSRSARPKYQWETGPDACNDMVAAHLVSGDSRPVIQQRAASAFTVYVVARGSSAGVRTKEHPAIRKSTFRLGEGSPARVAPW